MSETKSFPALRRAIFAAKADIFWTGEDEEQARVELRLLTSLHTFAEKCDKQNWQNRGSIDELSGVLTEIAACLPPQGVTGSKE